MHARKRLILRKLTVTAGTAFTPQHGIFVSASKRSLHPLVEAKFEWQKRQRQS